MNDLTWLVDRDFLFQVREPAAILFAVCAVIILLAVIFAASELKKNGNGDK